MNSPLSKLPTIILAFFFGIASCISPPDKNANGIPDDEEWDPQIPDKLFEENENTVGLTHLRDPSDGDMIPGEETGKKHFDEYKMPYDLLNPDETINLPAELQDITGLGIAPDGQGLIATNFKDGEIHFIDFDGELRQSTWFKRRGKYSGIEAVRNDIFVVKENGSIVHISELHREKPEIKVFNTLLNAKHQVGGMCYNPVQNELMLVCQGNGDDRSRGESKSIFVFDLERKELIRQPMFFIEDEDIIAYLDYFQPKVEDEGESLFYDIPVEKSFVPSAISVHPKTNEIYLISASSMQLIILSDDGDLMYVEKLDPFVLNQPEGMCIDVDGTLYISSKAGKGGTGRIVVFEEARRGGWFPS